ncbi:MAG TPA: Calx-beta domain-containing protein [Azospirillaceae bacterium]|nr:Calx-beta domain-containing protein [Azospirillaceae bacterium]
MTTSGIGLQIRESWRDGFVGIMEVPTSKALNGWRMTFEFPHPITQIWGAKIVKKVGNLYEIEGVDYTSKVAAGGSFKFGFVASENGVVSTPGSWTLNGTTYTAPAKQMPALSVSDVSLTEGHAGTQMATFTVKLSAASASTVTVNLATENGTAVAGSDYDARTGTLSFAPGETVKTFTVPVRGDTLNEANETFKLLLKAATNATILDHEGVATILNDESVATPVPPAIAVSDVSVVEGASGTRQALFTVRLDKAATGPVTVAYATQDGTALAGSDYQAATGSLTFAAGETSKTVAINILGDTAVETDETFSLVLSAPAGATLADATGVATIQNDDTAPIPVAPALSVSDVLVVEGASGTRQAVFTVRLDKAATGPVTVAYATQDGTAQAGTDYHALGGQLTFAAGETSKTVAVNILGDTAVETDETFNLILSAANGATIADATGVATIQNDDTAPTPVAPALSVSDVTVAEGASGTRQAVFTVRLDKAATGPVTVSYATQNGTATAGSDYQAAMGNLTFAAGETSKTVAVNIFGDTAVEANETFNLNLSAATGATIADALGVGTIQNDDSASGGGTGIGHNWGKLDPLMYRGSAYPGRDFATGLPTSGSTIIKVNPGTSVPQLQEIIRTAPKDAIVELQAGTHVFDQTLLIRRGDITVRGVGQDKTVIKASFSSEGDDIIQVRAPWSLDEYGMIDDRESTAVTTLGRAAGKDASVVKLASTANVRVGDFMEVMIPKPIEINHDNYLGSMGEIAWVDHTTGEVGLKHKLGWSAPVGAKVRTVDLLDNVRMGDFTIDYGTPKNAVDKTRYQNHNFEYIPGTDGNGYNAIYMNGVHEAGLYNITVKNAGSNAFKFTTALEVDANNLTVDGAQNIGAGGNGYGVWYFRTYYSDFQNLTFQNAIRHGIVAGAPGANGFNNFHVKYSDTNVDFHGGPDYANIYYVEKMALVPKVDYNHPAIDYKNPITEYQNTVRFDSVQAAMSTGPGYPSGAKVRPDKIVLSDNGGYVAPGGGGDQVWGGKGNDHFYLYGPFGQTKIHIGSAGGRDVLEGFNKNLPNQYHTDLLHIQANVNGSGINTVSDLLARAKSDGQGNTVIDLGGENSVTLLDIDPGSLVASHFTVY